MTTGSVRIATPPSNPGTTVTWDGSTQHSAPVSTSFNYNYNGPHPYHHQNRMNSFCCFVVVAVILTVYFGSVYTHVREREEGVKDDYRWIIWFVSVLGLEHPLTGSWFEVYARSPKTSKNPIWPPTIRMGIELVTLWLWVKNAHERLIRTDKTSSFACDQSSISIIQWVLKNNSNICCRRFLISTMIRAFTGVGIWSTWVLTDTCITMYTTETYIWIKSN